MIFSWTLWSEGMVCQQKKSCHVNKPTNRVVARYIDIIRRDDWLITSRCFWYDPHALLKPRLAEVKNNLCIRPLRWRWFGPCLTFPPRFMKVGPKGFFRWWWTNQHVINLHGGSNSERLHCILIFLQKSSSRPWKFKDPFHWFVLQ